MVRAEKPMDINVMKTPSLKFANCLRSFDEQVGNVSWSWDGGIAFFVPIFFSFRSYRKVFVRGIRPPFFLCGFSRSVAHALRNAY
jgi:hypothetical protein